MPNKSTESPSIVQQEMVTRPALWGFVIFLVSFSFVFIATSLYREYAQNIDTPLYEDTMPLINTPTSNTSVPANTSPEESNAPATTTEQEDAAIIPLTTGL